jgi:hypothetical protein
MTQLSITSIVGAPSQRALRVFLSAWLLAGTLDISAAIIYYPLVSAVKVITILQFIASGVLGNRAFLGGPETALFGLAVHYLIALIWTLVFFVGFRRPPRSTVSLVFIGMAYGVLVWVVMNVIVLPLSNVQQRPIHLGPAIIAALMLMFCIGLPIAIIVGKYRQTSVH